MNLIRGKRNCVVSFCNPLINSRFYSLHVLCSSASQINFDHVTDVMSQLVKHAVQEQPNNSQWLHTLADIYLGKYFSLFTK